MATCAFVSIGKPFIASLIFLELSLYATVSFAAMESPLPAELMIEGVGLQKSGDGEYGGRRHASEFPIVADEVEADAIEFPLTVEDKIENIMRASIQSHNNNGQNDNNGGGDDEMEMQHKHETHFNMANKLLQQQKQQRDMQAQLNNEEGKMLPRWLQQMHKEPSQQQPQQQLREYNNNNKAFSNAQQQHKLSLPHPHSSHESPASAQASVPVAPASRHCSIEISTKIPGICQTMAPIGSACVSGDYMEVYGSLDCM